VIEGKLDYTLHFRARGGTSEKKGERRKQTSLLAWRGDIVVPTDRIITAATQRISAMAKEAG